MKASERRQIRIFLGISLILLAIVGLLSLYLQTGSITRVKAINLRESAAMLEISEETIANEIREVHSNIRLLANLPSLKNSIKTGSTSDYRTAAEYFMKFAVYYQTYDQIRYIDSRGIEKIRINYRDDYGYIVPENELQNKSDRYYFIATTQLEKDECYVSPLDLNIEHGRIEFPLKPTVRFSTPVYSGEDQYLGAIVINYLASRIENKLKEYILTRGSALPLPSMLDKHGRILLSPETNMGESLLHIETTPSFAELNQELWQKISSEADGFVDTPAGPLVFRHLSYIAQIFSGYTSLEPENSGLGWIITQQIPRKYLISQTFLWLPGNQTFIIISVITILIISMLFSTSYVRRETNRIQRLQVLENHKKELTDARDTAEAANKAKSDFLASMSHEIRTPMNAVLGMAYLLDTPGKPPEVRHLAKKIQRAGQTLLSIINDILDFSKIEAGKMELEDRPFSINEVLDNIANIMARYAGEKKIELIISPNIKINSTLSGDCLRLEQVLINFIGNAIKFTDKGFVELFIDLEHETTEALTLRFSVRDSGIGMTAEQITRVFNAFEQADISTARRYGGTGLGLSISSRILRMMGGDLKVNSKPGQGTEFTFSLTLKKVCQAPLLLEKMKNLDVLIADDHKLTCAALGHVTGSLGWNATCVDNGKTVMEMAINNDETDSPFDLCLIDWQLQDMDGLAVAQAIKNRTSTPPLIITLVTGYSRPELEASPDVQYTDAILEKPVTPSSLYDCVIDLKHKTLPHPGIVKKDTDYPLSGIKILVVDDNDFNRDVAERIFSNKGAQVVTTDDGQQCLDWLQTNFADIILMDVQMPVMDGYEATRRIRSNERLKNIPIIALTAGAFTLHRQAAIEAGMDEFIAKPFNVANAVKTIIAVLENREQPVTPPLLSGENADTKQEKKLPLFDESRALETWKDKKTLLAYLQKFLNDYSDITGRLGGLGSRDKGRLAHKLKGAAASLYLLRLAEAAGELSKASAEGRESEPFLSALDKCYGETEKLLRETLQKTETGNPLPAENSPHDPAEIQALITELHRLLNADNPDVLSPQLNKLSALITPSDLKKLKNAISDFDFRAAEGACDELLEKIKIEQEVK